MARLEEQSPRREAGSLESLWTEVDGLSLHARASTGLSPDGASPVVLVHGLGVASRFMVPLAEALSSRHPVYALDLPGFGESEKPKRTLKIPELADHLRLWARAVGLERAVFLGNSLGCQVAVELALRRSETVEKLVLQGPTIDPEARTARQQIPRWLANSRNEPSSEFGISFEDYRKCGLRRLLKTFRLALEDLVEEKLPQVHVPTLVVRGSLDKVVSQAWAEEAARLLPAGRTRSYTRSPARRRR